MKMSYFQIQIFWKLAEATFTTFYYIFKISDDPMHVPRQISLGWEALKISFRYRYRGMLAENVHAQVAHVSREHRSSVAAIVGVDR